MNVNLKNAADVLEACAFAIILLAPAGKTGKWMRTITGGAWALLAVLLLVKGFSASA